MNQKTPKKPLLNETPLTPPKSNPDSPQVQGERGGPGGPEPTRYGDWERSGKCVDF